MMANNMDPDFLQNLSVDEYPYDPHYAQSLRGFFGDDFVRELTQEEQADLNEVTFCPILFGNRSGSNLLTNSLYRAGLGFPEHGEPLNLPSIERISERHQLETFTDYFLFLGRFWRQHNVVGFKISIGQLFDVTRTGLLNHFKNIKLLHSVRRDKLAQAVSHYIAKASGQWSITNADTPDHAVPYSAEDILRFLRRGARLQADYDLYLTIHGFSGMEICFEDFVSSPESYIEDIATFLNCPADLSNFDLQSAPTRPQASNLNQQFADRFRSELKGQS
jgi:LPS sulfotransferase NodH